MHNFSSFNQSDFNLFSYSSVLLADQKSYEGGLFWGVFEWDESELAYVRPHLGTGCNVLTWMVRSFLP